MMTSARLDDVRRVALLSHRSRLPRDELRRALAAITTLDAALVSHVLLALLLDSSGGGGASLVVLHAPHVFLLLLGTAALYHTLFAHSVLGWLQHLAVAATLCDVGAAVARLVLALRVADADREPDAVFWVYVVLALVLCAVDVAYAFAADALRVYAPPPIGNRDAAHAAVAHTEQRAAQLARAARV